MFTRGKPSGQKWILLPGSTGAGKAGAAFHFFEITRSGTASSGAAGTSIHKKGLACFEKESVMLRKNVETDAAIRSNKT